MEEEDDERQKALTEKLSEAVQKLFRGLPLATKQKTKRKQLRERRSRQAGSERRVYGTLEGGEQLPPWAKMQEQKPLVQERLTKAETARKAR